MNHDEQRGVDSPDELRPMLDGVGRREPAAARAERACPACGDDFGHRAHCAAAGLS